MRQTINSIVDTDTLTGLVNEKDALHPRIMHITQQFIQQEAHIYILPSTLSEFAILATIRHGFEQSKHMLRTIMSQGYTVLEFPGEYVQEASELYYRQTSKENSLFDCMIMVAARRYRMDCIFSFDGGYAQNKFVLIEEYLEVQESSRS